MPDNLVEFTDQQLSDWEAYEEVRQSGRINMYDARIGRQLACITRESYLFCMENYSELKACRQKDKGRTMTSNDWGDRTARDYGLEPLPKVYTEADMEAAVEAEREACEKIARAELSDWRGSVGAVSRIIDAIVHRKRDAQ